MNKKTTLEVGDVLYEVSHYGFDNLRYVHTQLTITRVTDTQAIAEITGVGGGVYAVRFQRRLREDGKTAQKKGEDRYSRTHWQLLTDNELANIKAKREARDRLNVLGRIKWRDMPTELVEQVYAIYVAWKEKETTTTNEA